MNPESHEKNQNTRGQCLAWIDLIRMNYIGSGVLGQDYSISSGIDLWEPDANRKKREDVMTQAAGRRQWASERGWRNKWNKRTRSQKFIIVDVRRVQWTFEIRSEVRW